MVMVVFGVSGINIKKEYPDRAKSKRLKEKKILEFPSENWSLIKVGTQEHGFNDYWRKCTFDNTKPKDLFF